MHPIERLRYVARSHGGDQRMLVRETAAALCGLGLDPAGIVVACRRIVERHPTSGPLWWLCATVVASADPLATARRLADEIEADPTPEVLGRELPADATVCVIGWPDLAGEAVLQRGDITVLAIDANDNGASFVRRLQRSDVQATVVPAAGLSGAVLVSDFVIVEALAACATDVLVEPGSRAATAVAYCAEVPVWATVGLGRCLPAAMFTTIVDRLAGGWASWDAPAEFVPLGLISALIRPGGRVAAKPMALAAECPTAAELLRTSPI